MLQKIDFSGTPKKIHSPGNFLLMLHIFVKNRQKSNAQAKFTSENLMPGQKLTAEKPNAQENPYPPLLESASSPPPPRLVEESTVLDERIPYTANFMAKYSNFR